MPEHYLPTLQGESIGKMGVALDMSGSVSNREASIYFKETDEMKKWS